MEYLVGTNEETISESRRAVHSALKTEKQCNKKIVYEKFLDYLHISKQCLLVLQGRSIAKNLNKILLQIIKKRVLAWF